MRLLTPTSHQLTFPPLLLSYPTHFLAPSHSLSTLSPAHVSCTFFPRPRTSWLSLSPSHSVPTRRHQGHTRSFPLTLPHSPSPSASHQHPCRHTFPLLCSCFSSMPGRVRLPFFPSLPRSCRYASVSLSFLPCFLLPVPHRCPASPPLLPRPLS